MDAFIGEIRLFAIQYVPQGYLLCDGSVLNAVNYQALYAVIGTIFGGSPASHTFALPNFQGRAPVGSAQGANVTPRSVGQNGGVESVTLATTQIPQHTHLFNGRSGNPTTRTAVPTSTSYLANFAVTPPNSVQTSVSGYAPAGLSTTQLHPSSIGVGLGNANGTTAPHENRGPYLVLDFYICFEGGAFPVHN